MRIHLSREPSAFRALRAAFLIALPALAIGCTSTKYTDGQVTFSRTSFLNVAKIARLQKGDLILEGYVNDQVAGAAAITRAAVEAALSRPPTPTPIDP